MDHESEINIYTYIHTYIISTQQNQHVDACGKV